VLEEGLGIGIGITFAEVLSVDCRGFIMMLIFGLGEGVHL